jgi:hypothetical protein
MVPEEFHTFFAAAAGASSALIGLLFVAITVAPERAHHEHTRTAFHARASAALVVFSNALVLSLAALVPRDDLGWWCLAGSLGMVAFASATARSGVAEVRRRPRVWSPFGLVAVLLAIAGFEVYAGARMVGGRADSAAVGTVAYLVIVDLLVGIARAWQLASMRDTGLMASLRVLARGDRASVTGTHSDGHGTDPVEKTTEQRP